MNVITQPGAHGFFVTRLLRQVLVGVTIVSTFTFQIFLPAGLYYSTDVISSLLQISERPLLQ